MSIRKIGIASCIAGMAFSAFSVNKKPNIIIILADDMGFSDIGCFGGEICTPNLDYLAAHGVRFKQFYNSARCCPSRASLQTGLYPHQTGLGHMTGSGSTLPGYTGELNNKCVTIAQVLHEAGYKNYMAGKWHVAKSTNGSDKHNWPVQRGYDRFFGTITGGGNYFSPNGLLLDNDFVEPGKDFYYTDKIAEYTCKFIDEHVKDYSSNPFFSYVAFTAPHWPLHATDSVMAKYVGRYSQGWDKLRNERFEKLKQLGIITPDTKLSDRNENSPAWNSVQNKAWESKKMEVYAAQVHQLDQGVGKILNTLRKNRQLDNTLIMFLSDNGGCAEELTQGWNGFLSKLSGKKYAENGDSIVFCNDPTVMPGHENSFQSCGLPWANAQNTPFRLFKHYVHEGGIRSPFIMFWPNGIDKQNTVIDYPGHITDLMATCVAVSHAKYPNVFKGEKIIPYEGKNLIPFVTDKEPNDSRILYWEHENNRAIRMGEWKLVSVGGKSWELYNLKSDETERNDLSETYPEKVTSMSKLWEEWAWRVHVYPNKKIATNE